ncbi:MAG: hypothetical protein ACK5I7_09200, partial [Anaerotignum sp.]
MEEKLSHEQMKLLSAMVGSDGSDAVQMFERIERLRRLFGNAQIQKPQDIEMKEASAPESPFGSERGENILFSAIPFLDLEFQKNIFVIVRLMELRRVLEGTTLVAREKQDDPVSRRHNMLRAVQPFLQPSERTQLDNMLKIMQMRDMFAYKEGK